MVHSFRRLLPFWATSSAFELKRVFFSSLHASILKNCNSVSCEKTKKPTKLDAKTPTECCLMCLLNYCLYFMGAKHTTMTIIGNPQQTLTAVQHKFMGEAAQFGLFCKRIIWIQPL